MTKRNKFAMMLLVLILSITLTGCSLPGIATPVFLRGSKISYYLGPEPKTLDPQMSDSTPELSMEMALFEGLTRLDNHNVPQPAIAQKIDVSADGLKYTFHLRDSKFSNGDSLTAEDFQYAWMRTLDPANTAGYAYQIAVYIKNGAAYYAKMGKAQDVGIKVIDPKTLEVTLENPTPYFLTLTALPIYYPVNKKVVETNKNWDCKAETYVSNGPFLIKSWIHNEKIVVVKNPNYWDVKSVKIKQLTFKLINAPRAALAAYEAGQVDGIYSVPNRESQGLLKSGELKITDLVGTYYYAFNVRKKPFDDPKVRQALTLAIDRQEIIDTIIQTEEKPAFAFIPYGFNDADISKQFRDVGGDYFSEDIAKARKLLSEAGFSAGKDFPEIKILFNSNVYHEKIALMIKDMWRKNLGITATLQKEEGQDYWKALQKNDFDVACDSATGDNMDPISLLDLFVKNGTNNKTGWSSSEYDALIAEIKKNPDPMTRMEELHAAEKILMREFPVMPIYYNTFKSAAKPFVKGVIYTPLGLVDFKKATLGK